MKRVWKKLLSLGTSLVIALALVPALLGTPAEAAPYVPGGDYVVDGWKIHCSRLDLGYRMVLEEYVGENKDFLNEVVFPSDFRGAEFGVHNAGQTVPINYIEGEAACGFLNATSFVFPNHVNTFRCVPVRDNPKLKTLVQPDGVESIRRMDLQDCPALESVYYPPTIGGVNNLFLEGTYAAGCTSLKDIYFYGEKPSNYDLLEIAEGKANAHLQVHYLEEHADSWADTYNATPFRAKGELALYGVVGEDYAVRVVDAVNGNAISGASVFAEYVQSGQNQTVSTGADGTVSIPGPYQFITVTAAGYYQDVSAPNGPMNVVYLTPNNVGDVLTKLTLARDDGAPYDILHMGGAYIVTPGAQKTLTFTAAAEGNASRYELWQPPRMLASSTDGVLKINDADLNTVRPLVIKTYFSGSQVPVFESVRVQVKAPNLPARVELGDAATLQVDPNAPLYGGMNFSANFGNLTIATATDPFTGEWRILLGKEVDDDDLLEKFAQVEKLIDIPSKEDTSDAWDDCAEAVTNTKKALQILNGTKGVSPLLYTSSGEVDIDWSIGAYLKGGMEDDVLAGRMFFSIEAEGSVSVGPPYPVYGSFGVIGRVEADGTLRLEMDTGSVQFLVGLNGEFGLKLSAGLGYDGAVSAGIYGEGVLGTDGQITNQRDKETGKSLSGFKELYLKGEFGAEYTFLWKEGDVALLTGKVTLWPELKTEGTVGPNAMATLGRRLTDGASYHDMDRDYLDREESAEETEPVTRAAVPKAASIERSLYHKGFYAPDAQAVILGGCPLVVRVDDAGRSRGANDRSALHYNMYTLLFNHWEADMLLADDGTADFSPSLCSDGTTAYVVWQNANRSLESVEATEAGQYFELSAAKITVGSSGPYNKPVTTLLAPVTKDNEVYENMPRAALLDNGTLGVAWVESSKNDVFGMQGTQTIKLSVYDAVSNTWTEQTIGTAEAGVTALALGSLDGSKFSIAWITDDDRDPGTEDDRALLLWTDGKAEVTALRTYSSPQSPAFVKLKNETVLTWYEGDVGRVIKYDKTGAEVPLGNFILSSAPTSIAGDSEGRIAVLSTETANNRGNIVLTAYDPATDAWGQTTQVVETAENSYFFQPKAVYCKADDLLAVAEKKNVTQMTMNVDPIHPENGTMAVQKNVGLAALKIGSVKPKFIVNGAYLDPETPEDGDDLRIVASVTNTGAVAGAPTLTMTGDMSIGTPQFTGLETIPSGGTVEIPLTLKKSDFKGGSYTVYVVGESATAPGILIGADLEVTARSLSVNGRNSVAIVVENKGAVNAEAGKLVVTDDTNGAPCAYFDLPAIPVGQGVKLVYDLADDGVFHNGGTAKLKVRASTPTVQTYLFNDSATVCFTKFSADMIEPDWTLVDVAVLSQVTYGQTNAQMFRDLPETGTTIGTAELAGTYTVSDPDAIQAAGDSRSVTVVFTVTAEGDHHGETFTKEYTVKVEKASIADILPTVTGTAKVGNTLIASLGDVIKPESQVDWQWFVISDGAGGGTPIPGATAASYSLVEEMAGATVAVKATAKEINYTGVSQMSASVAVEKLALSGVLTISETNGSGIAGVIDAGDTITAVTTDLLPVGAQAGGTFQWYRNDRIIDTALTSVYTVTGEDMDAVLKVVYTPDQSKYTGTSQTSVTVGKRVLSGTVTLTRKNDRLTATVSLENVPDDAYRLVWLRDGQEFECRELSYLLTENDKGHVFHVKVTALEESLFTGEVVSASVTIPTEPSEPSIPSEPSEPSGSGHYDNYYTLTASAGEGGCISPKGKVSVRRGTQKTFTITADEGYEISDVLVDGKSVGAVGEYVFQQVSRHHTIEALFKRVEQEGVKTPSFVDVAEDAWYHDAVVYVVNKGLFHGTSENTFGPNTTMTRSMLAAVLYRMAGQPDMPEANWGYPYADVEAAAYYTTAVYWARLQEIVKGYDDARFGPDDPITREQLAVMLWRYNGTPESDGTLDSFNDGAQAGEWATGGLCWAADQGILTGKDGGILDPKGQATRAEVATMLMRFCEKNK